MDLVDLTVGETIDTEVYGEVTVEEFTQTVDTDGAELSIEVGDGEIGSVTLPDSAVEYTIIISDENGVKHQLGPSTLKMFVTDER